MFAVPQIPKQALIELTECFPEQLPSVSVMYYLGRSPSRYNFTFQLSLIDAETKKEELSTKMIGQESLIHLEKVPRSLIEKIYEDDDEHYKRKNNDEYRFLCNCQMNCITY